MNMNFDMLNASPDGICVVDENYNIIFWNLRLEQWSKKKCQHFVGQKLTDMFPNLLQSKYKTRLDQVLENGPPAVFSALLHHHLFEFLTPNGSVQAQRVTISSFKGSDNQTLALFTIQDMSMHVQQISKYRDMVENYEVELLQRQALEKSNEQLVSAVDKAAEAFIIMRLTGEIEYVNKSFSEQTGWLDGDVSLELIYWDFHEEDNTGMGHLIKKMIGSGETWQGRRNILRKDGTSFIASVSIAPIEKTDGIPTHAVAIQEDISEQLKFEDQYRKTQKQEALSTLIGGIAHDFNNLLSGMLGHLYLANREVQEMPKTVERLKKIQTVANEIATIVQQLMTFARKGEVNSREFPLDSFVKEFSKLAEHTVPEDINLSIDFERDSFPCQGDAESLQESLLNIIQNAVDASVETVESKIRLSLNMFDAEKHLQWTNQYPVLKEGKYAQITIWDNGVGIDKSQVEKVFDPFFTTKHLGSGLGLAVAIGNVKKNRGILDVESDEDGTSFHIWLPLITKKAETMPSMGLNQQTHHKMVMLVDDEMLVRDTCCEILELLGYQVCAAVDGQDAVEKMREMGDKVDLIIMDMVMPRMTGSVAALHIRRDYPNIPIVFATAYDQSLSIKATREFDRSVLISKPFNPDSLQETVDMFISGETDI
ncbi:MAG: PAS domain S-box protein [Ghiorsea sp.]